MKMENWKEFMWDSNLIEGEDRLNPGDERAFKFACEGIQSIDDILTLHRLLGSYLGQNWVGKWREIQVQVGLYLPPKPQDIPSLMNGYDQGLIHFGTMDSWQAHNRFEQIHPFQDLNGRVGRLIWLSKAIHEGYDFSIPFLRKYYYQTLSHYQLEKH